MNESEENAGGSRPEKPDEPANRPRKPPRFAAYLLLNLGVWVFLALQALLLTQFLQSPRMMVLITLLLGLGFTAVSLFDYLYLRLTRR